MEDELIKQQTKFLYDWLRGNFDEKIMGNKKWMIKNSPKLSNSKSMTIIYVMQEFLRILPDSLEKCNRCGSLFDFDNEGDHISENDVRNYDNFNKKDLDKYYCTSCMDDISYGRNRSLSKEQKSSYKSTSDYEFSRALEEVAKKV